MADIRALIVDDEKGVRELLRLLLERNCKNVLILDEANDIDSAYEKILEHKPDLVFLDVQMPKGNGFELLEKFTEIDFEIVFTTSYKEFAIPAIKVNAIDYLLKPYDVEELKLAVEKVIKKRLLNPVSKKEIYVNVHKSDKVEKVKASDILALEAQSNYTNISTVEGQKHLISKSLNDLEELLSPLENFIRINRSIIINHSFIKSYSKAYPFTIVMDNNSEYEISRRRRSEIISILKKRN
ncbi:MAG: DNA-binding response regulator [Bacteroidetes bacterium]|jgi:two-component system LytT family response regulator|nr:DNA-binding response regulator [Bacteroidota bacterium]